MRKVRYAPFEGELLCNTLTPGKVYEVVKMDIIMTLLDDNGREINLFIHYKNGVPDFLDATAECRDEVIDSILN